MPSTVIVGLQWGDEGKGKIVDVISEKADIVARFSGGMNASHTVTVDGKSFHFSLIPSAVLRESVNLVIADGVVICPEYLCEEIEKLEENFDFKPSRLHIGQNAMVTFPYHVYLDRQNGITNDIHNFETTGMGHGPTRIDQAARQGVRISEYLNESFMKEDVFIRIKNLLNDRRLSSIKEHLLYFEKEIYTKTCKMLKQYICDTSLLLNNAIDQGSNVIFEGSQGTLLDILFGFYPHVTSSSTLAGGVCTGAGVGPTKINKIIGVVKAYSTRVSKGPMITEIRDDFEEKLRRIGNEYVHGSKVPMRVGWLDLVALRYAARLNSADSLALTKIDALGYFHDIQVCIAYYKNGSKFVEMPEDILSGGYQPIYKSMRGWTPFNNCKTLDEIPQNARDYIELIEDFTEKPVELISIGPERSETIEVS